MITTTLLGASVPPLTGAAGLVLSLRRRARFIKEIQQSWPEVSLARYRPVERLLAVEDFQFLERQPGYEPRMARKLRAERRDILWQYLRLMARDFNRVYAAAKQVLLHSTEDRPDLAATLIWLRVEFLFASVALRCRLALHPFGLPSLELRPVLGALERIADLARQLSPGQLAWATATASS